jgi:ferritin-like metal-binding protein YciE
MSIDLLSNRSPEQALNHPLLELPIPLKDGSSATVRELIGRFYDSQLAKFMQTSQKLRFSNYAYEREAMLSDIGPDVCPVGHQQETIRHAIAIIEKECADGTLLGVFDDYELAVTLLAIAIHDCGEPEDPALLDEPEVTRLVGDIPAGQKTDKDREDEANVRKVVYRTQYGDVDQAVIERVESIISHADKTVYHDLYLASHEAQTAHTVTQAECRLYEFDHGVYGDFPKDQARDAGIAGITYIVRERALEEARLRSYYTHVRQLATQISRPVTRHVVNEENGPYHEHRIAA